MRGLAGEGQDQRASRPRPCLRLHKVLETGRRMMVKQKPGYISVLAPVNDSLGDIVGLVEVVAQTRPDTHENVK
jgi:hypothetical protein